MTKPDRRTAHWHRKAAEERAKGKVRRSLWAHPDDWPEIQATAERLTERRESGPQCVTHIDGDLTNNSPENLRVEPMPKAEHKAHHRREKEQSDATDD